MASDDPLPDRCGASVTTKVGLKLEDDTAEQTYRSDNRLESLVVEKGAVRSSVESEYEEVMDYTRQGFSVSHVNLSPSEEDDGDELVSVDVEDDDPYMMHTETTLDGYCERFPMDNGRCYVHGGASDSPAPEGNTRGMTHGLHAKRSNYYDQLSESEQALVQQIADSWIDNAPFDRDNFAKVNEIYRIAIDQHRLWNAHDEFGDGLTFEQVIDTDESGDPIIVEDENPANLAYDRLDRTTVRKLKEYGCLDDPESKKAEATETLADKFSELE